MDETKDQLIEELQRERRRHRRVWMGLASAAVLAWAVPVFSQTMVPYVFSPNTPARASEINANFAALASEIDANRARVAALEGRDDFVPAGTIAFFGTSSCPPGWSEHEAADGRFVVAVTGPDGTAGALVGTALADQQNKTHRHTIAHRHQWAHSNASTRTWSTYMSATPGSGPAVIIDWGNGIGNNSGHWPLESERTAWHYTGDPTQGNSGTVSTGDFAPFIQLRACRKDS